MKLKREGIFVTFVQESKLKSTLDFKGGAAVAATATVNPVAALRLYFAQKNASRQQISIITRQLAVLLKAGVPLAEALGALVEQSESDTLKEILSDVRQQVNEGSSLADAMARQPPSFEDLFVHMIRAGEASGALEQVRFRLAEFLDAQNRL